MGSILGALQEPAWDILPNTPRACALLAASPEPLFDFLAPTGWDAQWVDGITRDICRMPEGDDVAKADAAVSWVLGDACGSMVVSPILACTPRVLLE